jgi:O-antigen/teichoic acid export membrane protein
VYFVGLLFILVAIDSNPTNIVMALMLSCVVTLAWIIWRLWGRFTLSLQGVSNWIRPVFSFSIRSMFIDVVATALTFVDKVALINFVSVEDLGLYTVAFSLSRLTLMLQTAVPSVVYPLMAGKTRQGMIDLHDQAFRFVLYIVLVVIAGTAVFGQMIISVLYGKSFASVDQVLLLLVAQAGFECLCTVVVQLYMTLARPGLASTSMLVSLAASAALLLALVPTAGILGAALALLLSSIVRLGLLLAGMTVVLKVPLPRLMPTRSDLSFIMHRLG